MILQCFEGVSSFTRMSTDGAQKACMGMTAVDKLWLESVKHVQNNVSTGQEVMGQNDAIYCCKWVTLIESQFPVLWRKHTSS